MIRIMATAMSVECLSQPQEGRHFLETDELFLSRLGVGVMMMLRDESYPSTWINRQVASSVRWI